MKIKLRNCYDFSVVSDLIDITSMTFNIIIIMHKQFLSCCLTSFYIDRLRNLHYDLCIILLLIKFVIDCSLFCGIYL